MEPCPWNGSVAAEVFAAAVADVVGVSTLAVVRTTSAQKRTRRCREVIGPVLSLELVCPARRA
jgi:hypothetical protein